MNKREKYHHQTQKGKHLPNITVTDRSEFKLETVLESTI